MLHVVSNLCCKNLSLHSYNFQPGTKKAKYTDTAIMKGYCMSLVMSRSSKQNFSSNKILENNQQSSAPTRFEFVKFGQFAHSN